MPVAAQDRTTIGTGPTTADEDQRSSVASAIAFLNETPATETTGNAAGGRSGPRGELQTLFALGGGLFAKSHWM